MVAVKPLLGTLRIPFLVLTPCCLAVGVGTAIWQTGPVSLLDVVLVLIAGVAAHACVNVFNEYFDFRSGLDAHTARTPFSGGSGTLQALPELAPSAFGMAAALGGLTALIGLYFMVTKGWALLPVGVAGFAIAYIYTNWLTKNPFVCLVTPGTGFGLIFVLGTHYALTGAYSWSAFIAALVPFFLVSNLLLINQFPDVGADSIVGKKHFPLLIGRRRSAYIYGAFLLGTYMVIVVGVLLRLLPWPSLLGLLTAPLSWRAFRGAVEHADDIPNLIPILGLNVEITLLTPLLLAAGLAIGAMLP
jgi:1,4-dihydroxy-2-naphthoate octaprenyltransferase